MELQLQRQQAQAQRQTLDRLARRPPASAAAAAAPVVQPNPAPAQPKSEGSVCGSNSGFLLTSLAPDDLDSGPGSSNSVDASSAKQDLFLAELLLGALSIQSDEPKEQS